MTARSDSLNLRHLRAFVEVCRMGSISQASATMNLSQPAITHGVANLELRLRAKLFTRGPRGMTPTEAGVAFRFRVERALADLNSRMHPSGRKALPEGMRVEARVTSAQLRALLAIAGNGSYSAAARALDAAQPTVYRAARELENNLGIPLFEQAGNGVHLTRAGLRLAQNAGLALAELDQGLQEIRAASGQDTAMIRIGALPLARATILARAMNALSERNIPIRANIDDGPYSDLLQALRTGALDILVGALREPAPASDVTQEALFSDRLGVFCGPDHPIRRRTKLALSDLAGYPWVVPRQGTPTRRFFEKALAEVAATSPEPLIETSSMILNRELLQSRNRLTLISRAQVATEVRLGMMFELPINLNDPARPIGITRRSGWHPTAEQSAFLEALRCVSKAI